MFGEHEETHKIEIYCAQSKILMSQRESMASGVGFLSNVSGFLTREPPNEVESRFPKEIWEISDPPLQIIEEVRPTRSQSSVVRFFQTQNFFRG